jgi:hypothetical protein
VQSHLLELVLNSKDCLKFKSRVTSCEKSTLAMSALEKLDEQIENYDESSYGCTLESLVAQRCRAVLSKARFEKRQSRRDAKAKLKYYRSLTDTDGDRTHTDDGVAMFDQWGRK